jgi:acetyl-CoA acetyltransferase
MHDPECPTAIIASRTPRHRRRRAAHPDGADAARSHLCSLKALQRDTVIRPRRLRYERHQGPPLDFSANLRGGPAPEEVDYVIMGHVLQAGCGQMTARQAAVKAGIPMTSRR